MNKPDLFEVSSQLKGDIEEAAKEFSENILAGCAQRVMWVPDLKISHLSQIRNLYLQILTEQASSAVILMIELSPPYNSNDFFVDTYSIKIITVNGVLTVLELEPQNKFSPGDVIKILQELPALLAEKVTKIEEEK